MATQLGDQDQTRLALASLFAALVQTLGEQDEALCQCSNTGLNSFIARWKIMRAIQLVRLRLFVGQGN